MMEIALVGIVVVLGVGIFHRIKPLPYGVSFHGGVHGVHGSDLTFVGDRTYFKDGKRQSEHAIFDALHAMIGRAERFIVVDMFLFNSARRGGEDLGLPLAERLADTLIERKRSFPAIEIVVLIDEINTFYGGYEGVPEFVRLRAAGISVVPVRLSRLRDSNPLYSMWWRVLFQWMGNGLVAWRVLPHPFVDGEQVSVRSYLALLNFKANHRKVAIADDGDSACLFITSANPHNGSAWNDNVALVVRGAAAFDALDSERGVASFSGYDLPPVFLAQGTPMDVSGATSGATVSFLTESKIRDALLAEIEATQTGNQIDMMMFYLSHRSVVRALVDASLRGVAVRIVLDPTKDAFGYQKSGVPNTVVAAELIRRSNGRITIRFADTHGEQFHSKMVIIRRGGQWVLTLGSANLTRRKLDDYNLEANIWVSGNTAVSAIQRAQEYFEDFWENRGGRHYTMSADERLDRSRMRFLRYRLQEALGLGIF